MSNLAAVIRIILAIRTLYKYLVSHFSLANLALSEYVHLLHHALHTFSRSATVLSGLFYAISAQFARIRAVATGGQTAFPRRAICFASEYFLPIYCSMSMI